MILSSVHGNLDFVRGIRDQFVDAEEDDLEYFLDEDEHAPPLEVRPAVTCCCLLQVQGDEGAVGGDADDGGESEGKIPTADVSDSERFGLPGQSHHTKYT